MNKSHQYKEITNLVENIKIVTKLEGMTNRRITIIHVIEEMQTNVEYMRSGRIKVFQNLHNVNVLTVDECYSLKA